MVDIDVEVADGGMDITVRGEDEQKICGVMDVDGRKMGMALQMDVTSSEK